MTFTLKAVCTRCE